MVKPTKDVMSGGDSWLKIVDILGIVLILPTLHLGGYDSTTTIRKEPSVTRSTIDMCPCAGAKPS